MKRLLLGLVILLSPLMLVASVGAAMPVPPLPNNGGYVLDQTSTISATEIQTLNEQIDTYSKKTGVEIGILMISTIKDDYIENFSLNVAREWGIGKEGKNNGTLLVIAKDDHQMRIEVGRGLEGNLTDVRSSRIIRDRIAPEFRKGNYYFGIRSGILGMQLAINAEEDASLRASDDTSSSRDIMTLLGVGAYFFLFGLSWLGSIWGRSKRWWPGGVVGGLTGAGIGGLLSQSFWGAIISAGIVGSLGLLFDFIVSRNYKQSVLDGSNPSWWAGGPWTSGGGGIDSGSGGGFGGFGGGGGFSGGGSSGDW